MADFEGEKRLNRETSEFEVKDKFKITEEELDKVSGGVGGGGKSAVSWNASCSITPSRWEGSEGAQQICNTCNHVFDSGIWLSCTLLR